MAPLSLFHVVRYNTCLPLILPVADSLCQTLPSSFLMTEPIHLLLFRDFRLSLSVMSLNHITEHEGGIFGQHFCILGLQIPSSSPPPLLYSGTGRPKLTVLCSLYVEKCTRNDNEVATVSTQQFPFALGKMWLNGMVDGAGHGDSYSSQLPCVCLTFLTFSLAS